MPIVVGSKLISNVSHIPGRGSVLRVPLVDLGSQVLARSLSSSGDPATGENLNNNVPPVDQSEGAWRLQAGTNDPTPAILGLWTPISVNPTLNSGRLVVYGDADCLMSTHVTSNCFWLLDAALQFANNHFGRIPSPLSDHVVLASGGQLDPLARQPTRPPGQCLETIFYSFVQPFRFFQ
ncbi:unnamed protein product [Echinostoma caproni]|uniref:MBTPS1 fourth domain-containing protein n=1 Tax=Echinostoma caproni TaxID=27848 RepID=A0A183BGA2_9TREM|nr:unnamed protein product [Echinostoma caproni]